MRNIRIPQVFTLIHICRFLRAGGKQKIPISLGNQDFTTFCFSSKWCHQELYFIYKWLYIITFQKRKKGNLLLLLHLEFALFCASLRGGFLLQR